MSKSYTGLGILFVFFSGIKYCFKKESIPSCLLPVTMVAQASENVRS